MTIKRKEIEKDIEGCFNEFQRYNEVKNLSPASIRSYKYNVVRFFDFAEQQGICNIANVSSHVIEDFTLYLRKRKIKSITINTHLKATRAFLYYCMEKDYLPQFKIHLIKQEEQPITLYSDEDVKKLIAKPNLKKCSFVEYRNWVMVNYFLETGNRLRSVLNIKISDIDFTSRTVTIRATKNGDILITPLTKTLVSILPPYIETWGLTGYLFPGDEDKRIREDSVKQSIARYNRRRGVKITSIHAFRHVFARNYIITGGNAFKLQSLLGHKDLEMTRHYVQLFGQDLSCDIDEHSIVERIKPTTNRVTRQTLR